MNIDVLRGALLSAQVSLWCPGLVLLLSTVAVV